MPTQRVHQSHVNTECICRVTDNRGYHLDCQLYEVATFPDISS